MGNSDKPHGGRRRRSSDVALTGNAELNRKSFVPLYFQLAEALKKLLETGAWQPGARFPSEREIAEEFGVSRTVIRPALDLLVGDGAIVRTRGSGTFVAPPKREVPILGLVKALAVRPEGLTVTVVTASEESPGSGVRHFLDLDHKPSPVVHVTAVLRVDGRPICVVDSNSVSSYVPWLLSVVTALKSGAEPPEPGKVELTRSTSWIEGTFLGQWSASQLRASAGEPALLGRLVQFGKVKGRKRECPLEFARLICSTGGAQLSAELH
jgi:DNA-binding GntR family transcriptional regulator